MTLSQNHLVSDAYLAGLFDGEGTFCTNISPKSGGGYTFRAAVNMTCPIPPEKFLARFGGALYTYQPKRSKARLTHEWHASGLLVVDIAEALLPYLLVKKPQAELLVGLRKALEIDGRKAGGTAEIYSQRSAAGRQLAVLNRTVPC